MLSKIAAEQFPDRKRVCFNAARWHPLPKSALEAVQRHAVYRAQDGDWGEDIGSAAQNGARAAFARLIGADDREIALVPSTTVAEQMIVRALGLPETGAIVTDLMHYDGSIYAYDALAGEGGDLRIVAPRDGRIDLADVEAALAGGNVRLVSVSAVSNMTGFSHDLSALCALAHRYDAMVYADIVQAVGAVPLDVRSLGLDFCAASGFKWMMGEMGLGFLYVRHELLARLQRPIRGDRQLTRFPDPWPPIGPRTWLVDDDSVAGHFECGSLPIGVAVSLQASLGLIEQIGVGALTQYRAPMLARIDDALMGRGYPRITPADSYAPFRCYEIAHPMGVADRLRATNINAGILGEVLRISVSLCNRPEDVDRLLDALL